jgi:hypothetical protein
MLTHTGIARIKENTACLVFEPDGHKYSVLGKEIMSVTTIIGASGLSEYDKIAKENLAFACARGTLAHKITEYVDAGIYDKRSADAITEDVKERYGIVCDFDGYARAYQKFLGDYEPEWELKETPLYSPRWMYAGTPDRIGVINAKRYIVDIKTGETAPAACVQLHAYSAMFNEIVPPKDRIQKKFVLFLKDNGEYKFVESEETYKGFRVEQVWMSAVTIANCKRGK